MTGRKGRVVSRPDGTVAFESRAEQGLSIDHVNLREKERFMSGEKVGAVETGPPGPGNGLCPQVLLGSSWCRGEPVRSRGPQELQGS